MALVDKNFKDQLNHTSGKKRKTTDKLVFKWGHTNPLIFINEFEKCADVPTDLEKLLKIRSFVDDAHKGTENYSRTVKYIYEYVNVYG